MLKSIILLKGSYNSCSSGANNYFVSMIARLSALLQIVFPQSMKGKVYRGQVEQKSGVLVAQSVPPLLPAYNKFIGGVDKTDQLHKYTVLLIISVNDLGCTSFFTFLSLRSKMRTYNTRIIVRK